VMCDVCQWIARQRLTYANPLMLRCVRVCVCERERVCVFVWCGYVNTSMYLNEVRKFLRIRIIQI